MYMNLKSRFVVEIYDFDIDNNSSSLDFAIILCEIDKQVEYNLQKFFD